MECNIPSELEDSVRELLGAKRADSSYRRLVRLDVKADKQEQRILALTDYRLFILTAKLPAKVEHNVPYLDFTCVESKKPTQLVVSAVESKKLSMSLTEKDAESAIKFIQAQLRYAFPTSSIEELLKLDIEPSDRQRQLCCQPRESMLRDVGPCGGFSTMYEAMCDYYHQPFLEDVAWDVDTIYLSQDSKELNLSDFDHLGIKHLVPIIGTLQYDTWFTSLNANNVRLTTEAVNEVLRVMRKNTHLEELHARNIGVKWEFAHKLAMALLHNNDSQLTVLDLSENQIEDRGINHLCSPVRTLQRGLKHLNLSRTGITAKGVNRLADSLCANKSVTTSLTFLDLSENSLKGEDITNLYNFWARPNVISTLRLSSTECALENLFGALLPGCVRHLQHLDLSHNFYSHRKTKDPTVPPAWKQFFATAESLQTVNLADCKLSAEALKHVVLGLASNLKATSVDLDVSSNNLRTAGSDILQMSLPEMRNITTFNISDNAFDNDMMGICSKMTQCRCVKKLLIGRNFNNVKPKYMGQVMDSVVQMIQDEESAIESLSLADSKLKNDTTIIINALGSNSSLTEIDLSGNLMGDVGARMLAKALQINTKLHTIYWDRNGTSVLGLADIAQGISKNHSVKKMPSPLNDAAIALRLNAERTEQALQKIEAVLKRNHSPRKLEAEKGYRLQQGFLISSSQQMLDRLVVQVKEHITTLEKGGRNLTEDAKNDIRNATRLVSDANATKQLLPKLQKVALQVEDEGNLIDTKLSTVSQDLHSATQRQLKRTMSDMMKCMEQQCPTIMEDDEFTRSLQTSSVEKSLLPDNFTKTLLIDNVGADIMNKVSELNLAVAAHVSDRLIDGVLDSLDACHKKLTNHINSVDSLSSPLSPLPETKKSVQTENPPALDKKLTVTIAEDAFDEVAAQSTIKRKSLYSRRLRPQSVIDAADVKKALKMTEIDISGGGSGRLTEEEHENEKAGTVVGRAGALSAPCSPDINNTDVVVDVVDGSGYSTASESAATVAVVVDNSVVKDHCVVDQKDDDSHANLSTSDIDKKRTPSESSLVMLRPTWSCESEPDDDPDIVKVMPSSQDQVKEVKEEPFVLVDKEDIPDMGDESTSNTEAAEATCNAKGMPESEPNVKDKVKEDPDKVKEDPDKVKEDAVTDKIVQDKPKLDDSPKAPPRTKAKLRAEGIVRPESKVASRMNAGFLAELAAGIGGGPKSRKPPAPSPPKASLYSFMVCAQSVTIDPHPLPSPIGMREQGYPGSRHWRTLYVPNRSGMSSHIADQHRPLTVNGRHPARVSLHGSGRHVPIFNNGGGRETNNNTVGSSANGRHTAVHQPVRQHSHPPSLPPTRHFTRQLSQPGRQYSSQRYTTSSYGSATYGSSRQQWRRMRGYACDEEGKSGDIEDGSRENKDLSPIPQSPGTPKSPSLSLRSASSASDISLPPLEELPKLEHLGKSRPRRNKTRAVSRAVLKADRSIEDIKEVETGIDEFFERKELSRELVEAKVEEKDQAEKGDEEKKDDSKKKGWSPFNNQPNPKGLAAGISNFFGRRGDKPSPTRSSPESSRRLTSTDKEETSQSPEPARRSINKSPTPERRRTREKKESESEAAEDEVKDKKEEEPTPPWRRSVVLPSASSGSSSGSASALLAEMRAKRASASIKPTSPTSTKSDNKENKENKSAEEPLKRSSIIPPPAKENRNSIHPPASVKDRSSAAPSVALRQTSGQTSTRPVPAPRTSSPATTSEKSDKAAEDSSGDSSPKSRLSFLSKPRPPPIAPKPRAKPSSGATTTTSSAKPTIITTPRTSESIGEKPSLPSSASTEKENSSDKKDSPAEPAQPPTRSDRARRRLSVKEKVAFLDKNSNEQPAEQPLGRRASLAKADQAAKSNNSDNPQRVWSMYGGESPRKDDDQSPGGVSNVRGRHDKPSDDDNHATPNGAAKKDGEFVLFL